MNEITYKEYVTIFKALADETRLKIVEMLRCGEMCACDILKFLDIAQSSLSYHMKILTDSGLVIGTNDGKWVRYTISREKVELIKGYFDYIA